MAIVEKFISGQQVAEELRSAIAWGKNIRVAVAFCKEGGYREIENDLKKALEEGKDIEFVVGACPHYRITDYSVLGKLMELKDE